MTSFSVKGSSFLIDHVNETDIFTPEDLSFEQKELGKAAEKFSTREIFSQAERIEAKEEGAMASLLKKAGDQGLMMVEIPEEYGGMGLNCVAGTQVSENITHQTSFSVAFMCHTGIGTMPVLYFGSEEQKKKYLPKLASGEMISAYSLTEANAGSDAMSLRTKAVLSPDKKNYILNGEKLFLTNGGIADLITVFVKTPDDRVTAFLIERAMEGISFGKEEDKMGIRGSSTVSMTFTDTKVPIENVLGEVGQGHKIAFNSLDIGRFKLGAACLGAMKRLIELMTAYANERHQFGKPISSFELIREMIVKSVIHTYLAESQVYRYAATFDDAIVEAHEDKGAAIKEYAVEASIIKIFCSEVLDQIADDAVQIYGGYGYIRDYPVEHHYRDSRINRIFEGTNEINKLVITGTLLKRALAGTLPLMDRLQEILVQLKSGFPEANPNEPLGIWVDQIERLKRLCIYVAGVAAQSYATEIEKHQSVMALIADLAIDVYALESGLLRALKKKSTLHEAVIKAAITNRVPLLHSRTKQALINIAGGDDKKASPYLKAFDRIVSPVLVDTGALYEKIASHVLEREAYEL